MIAGDGHIKLIDFGFAKVINKERAYTNCGTLGYTAPEVLTGVGYSYSADVWSFGMLVVVLLTGQLPFTESDPMLVNEAIVKGDIKLDRNGIDGVARHLLQEVLSTEPNLRPPLSQVLENKFFTHLSTQKKPKFYDQIRQKLLKPPFIPDLTRY